MGGHLGNTESTAGKSVNGTTQSLKKKRKVSMFRGDNKQLNYIYLHDYIFLVFRVMISVFFLFTYKLSDNKRHQFSSVAQLCLTLYDPLAACQAPLSMEFSKQEYWTGLSFHIPGDLPDQGVKPTFFAFPKLAGGFLTTMSPVKLQIYPQLFTNTLCNHVDGSNLGFPAHQQLPKLTQIHVHRVSDAI